MAVGNAKVWDGSAWAAAVGSETPWAIISETPTGSYNDGQLDWNYWIYKANGTLTVTEGGRIDYLVVAGGSGGASSNDQYNIGAGGAGGVIESTEFAQIEAGSYPITIGAGAAQQTSSGQGLLGSNSSIGSIAVAIRGGRGASRSDNGGSGGCGGGAGDGYPTTWNIIGGDPVFGQGYRGGHGTGTNGGAGGGAGENGGDGGGTLNGGNGRITTIIPSSVATAQSIGEVSGGNIYFAGGGAAWGGTGGLGGGGDNGPDLFGSPNCPPNTGGGSSVGDINNGAPYAGAGGSGVVIVRTKI